MTPISGGRDQENKVASPTLKPIDLPARIQNAKPIGLLDRKDQRHETHADVGAGPRTWDVRFGQRASCAFAQVPAGIELGPKVGAKAPAFSVISSSGETKSFETLKGRQGLVLVFVRSADWCPFCKVQLQDLNSGAKDLDALGWPMVAVSYDPVETLERFSTTNKLDYRLLSDPGSNAIDAFGIRNESVNGSARFNGIPHPLIIFIGADGMIKAKLYEERYQDRPPSGLVLETAKGLG